MRVRVRVWFYFRQVRIIAIAIASSSLFNFAPLLLFHRKKKMPSDNTLNSEHVFQEGDYEASATAAPRGWAVSTLFQSPVPGNNHIVNQTTQVNIHAADVIQLTHREQGLLLGGTKGGYATMVAKRRTRDIDLSTLWQVCHHGPYTQTAKSGTAAGSGIEGKEKLSLDSEADVIVSNFINSRRLEGGDIELSKDTGVISAPLSLRNVLTGQYLCGPTKFNPLIDNEAHLEEQKHPMDSKRGDRKLKGPVHRASSFHAEGYKEKWQNAGLRIMKALKKKKVSMHMMKKKEKKRAMEFNLDDRAMANSAYDITEPDRKTENIYGQPLTMKTNPLLEKMFERTTFDIGELQFDDSHSAKANTEAQMRLSNDSQGGGFGSSLRSAFGFVAVDNSAGYVVDRGFYCIRDQLSGKYIHFPEDSVPAHGSDGSEILPPELQTAGQGSFEDVFSVNRVDDDFLKDVYFVQGKCTHTVSHITYILYTYKYVYVYTYIHSTCSHPTRP